MSRSTDLLNSRAMAVGIVMGAKKLSFTIDPNKVHKQRAEKLAAVPSP